MTGYWRVDLDAEQRLPCSLQELGSLEVWVGSARIKAVSSIEVGLEILEDSPDGLVILDKQCVITTTFGLNEEERSMSGRGLLKHTHDLERTAQ